MQYGIYILCFVSALTAPWWVTLVITMYALSFSDSAPYVVGVGVVMDALYGSAVPSLYGFSALYTTLFLLLSVFSVYLRSRVLD